MTYFFLGCWNEISKDAAVCPHCGEDQAFLGSESYIHMLIWALYYPEPETPSGAATLLGNLRPIEAVRELTQWLSSSADPYVAAACAEAPGNDQRPATKDLVDALRDETLVIVRRALSDALGHRHHNEGAHD
jgi:hypothetical protein